LTALLGEDLVVRDDDGTYHNAPVSSRHLIAGAPEYLGALAAHQDGHFGRFDRLTDALRADAPVETSAGGAHPAFGGPEKFAAVTRAASVMMAGGLASGAPLKGHRHLVDLGCGSGVYTIALANANPELRITAVDQPAVCELARRNIAEAGLGDRVTVVAGDIFVDTFGDADVALLSNVVEGFAPDRARQLLQHVYGWLPSDGELLLHAHMWEHARTSFPYTIGLILLVNNTVGGEPYGAQVTEDWLRQAGFDEVSTAAVSPISALARAHKS
jgi:predicted nicotinamide N-methyase